MMPARRVTDTIPAYVIPVADPDGNGCLAVDAEFTYCSDEPLTITVEMADSLWTFSRDLLRVGCDADAGVSVGFGDVVFYPAPEWADALYMYLRPPGGEAWVVFPKRRVVEFMWRAVAAVPYGSETVVIDDRDLAALLDGPNDPPAVR